MGLIFRSCWRKMPMNAETRLPLFVRNDRASERRARFPVALYFRAPALVPLIKAYRTHWPASQGWNRKQTKPRVEAFGLRLCLWSIGGGMMDLRLFLPVALLAFGLATVFAQTSAPGRGRSQLRKQTTCLSVVVIKGTDDSLSHVPLTWVTCKDSLHNDLQYKLTYFF